MTEREHEIVALVFRGPTNRRIAQMLHLSVRTAESHVCRASSKAGIIGGAGLRDRIGQRSVRGAGGARRSGRSCAAVVDQSTVAEWRGDSDVEVRVRAVAIGRRGDEPSRRDTTRPDVIRGWQLT